MWNGVWYIDAIKLNTCPIHVVTFTLISNLATNYIQKRRGQTSLLNIICCQIWYQRKSDYMDRALQSIIYQYYKLKLQCTVYSAALHGCTALHCFLSFQVSLQCDSHFSHDWAPQESLKSSSGDSLGSHRYKRPAKARRPAIWLAYIQAAAGSGPVEHFGSVGIYPKGPSQGTW